MGATHAPRDDVNAARYADFLGTTRALLRTGDLDPVYPFLRQLVAGWGPDHALWLVQLYAAYYRVDSAWVAGWHVRPVRESRAVLPPLAIAPERRNLRSAPRFREHLIDLAKADQDYWTRVRAPLSWRGIYEAAYTLRHNGPWAAFKWTDLARYVLQWSFSPTPPMVATGAGPAAGLTLLESDLMTLARALAGDGLVLPWDQVETALCKWHGCATGHYHVGKDLQELDDQCVRHPPLAAAFARTNFALERVA